MLCVGGLPIPSVIADHSLVKDNQFCHTHWQVIFLLFLAYGQALERHNIKECKAIN
jgi:hypothetical protein